MKPRIYLDSNASTPVDPQVKDLLIKALHSFQGNPSSTHIDGQKARKAISQARHSIAAFLKAAPQEIIFTSGGTESANMVIRGLTAYKHSGHIITSSVEHSCVFGMLKELSKQGFEVTFLSPGPWGAITPEAVLEAIRPDTILIALMAANNETGVKTDIDAIAKIAETRNISFFVDAVALLGKELFDIPLGVSAMGFSGHKIHALQGTGFAFVRKNLKLFPSISGGEQEYGKRAGTENVLGIMALGKAVEILASALPSSTQYMLKLRDKLEKTLLQHLTNVVVNGEGPRIANVSNLAFLGKDGESLLMALDQQGIAASHGSACSSGSIEPSRILLNMGLPLDRVTSSIRFSLSRFTTTEEIDNVCNLLIKMLGHS